MATIFDFPNSPGFSSLTYFIISFIVLGLAIYLAARLSGIKESPIKAFGISLVIMLFSLVQLLIKIDRFFLLMFLGAIGVFSIIKSYKLKPEKALFMLFVSVVVYIVLDTVIVPFVIPML